MPASGSQLSSAKRPKWPHVSVGIALIVVAVALTVGWQILGASDGPTLAREASTLRWVVYFFGSLLFLLLIGGLVLIVILLLREVRLNERQSNFISAVTHELKTPVASLKLYLDTLRLRDLPEAGLHPQGVARIAAGQHHRAAERMAAQETRLVDGPPERRAQARDGPAPGGESGQPAQERFVLAL